jgi:Zn-dependent protease with chaperone function
MTVEYLNSYLCMYIVQSVVHSVITLFLVEMSLKIWKIKDARERFRYRLQVLLMPLVMFPLFQFVNPDRGSLYFIQDIAIFSTMRWLRIELWGKLPLAVLFAFVLVATSVLTLIQEVGPTVRNLFVKKTEEDSVTSVNSEIDLMISELSNALNIEKPSINIVNDESPLLLINGVKKPSIIISESLLERFNKRELRGALAHELAHIVRRSGITTLLVFLVRMLMFYNPVSLLVFRRLIQEDEKVCDDITVSITKDPKALASALAAFYSDVSVKDAQDFSALKDVIQSSSHNLLLEERISRLKYQNPLDLSPFQWGGFILTRVSVLIISYLVV